MGITSWNHVGPGDQTEVIGLAASAFTYRAISFTSLQPQNIILAHTSNHRSREAEAGGSGVSGQPGRYSQFQASQGYTMRSCPNSNNNNK